ncbi:hypothetical protein F6R98_13345 [Candidatus Methylospira mobilis]|uniref:Uncharacterized protein n=1 Tax=Candidatus Methylospira mobilis TaxID=1808979 RepID=A0A5Q0BK29_9GAMM|nr:hypothetical protein [Candidatus Methylospira mobilis]QFY43482.1 hypothetical protein F6R98_13345 [Candidatus Methylospira mobilis]WNV03976.1 hypothetical protein RP726_16310 [Candidatus Methylospira mobilis]
MSINSINSELYRFSSSFASSGLAQSGSTSAVQNQQSADGSKALLAQGVVQTLNQSGINTSSGSQSRAVHALMHDIFQAVQQGSSSNSVGTAKNSASTSAYSQISNNLQSLIQQLGSNASGGNSQNSTLNKLQSDYNALVQSVGGVSATQNTTGLQNFLSTLSQNLNSAGSSTPAPGSLIHTTA